MAYETVVRNPRHGPVACLQYAPRDATGTVLHQVVREHLESFPGTTTRADPSGLPTFLEQEFRAFLDCGVWARGFAVATHQPRVQPALAGLFACGKRQFRTNFR